MPSENRDTFVADDFDVPDALETAEFRLRMLSVDDVVKDYDAVMSSIEHLRGIWPQSGWPDGLTLEDNLVDLGRHQQEFLNRTAFAYTVVTLDESEVIGCVYFDPTRKQGFDAEIYLWVRENRLQSGLDAQLYVTVKQWLVDHWPFKRPGYPGREVDWNTWNALEEERI